MGQRAAQRDKVSDQPALMFLSLFAGRLSNGSFGNVCDRVPRLRAQRLLVLKRRGLVLRLPCGTIDLGKVLAELSYRRQLAADPAEIGAQHVVGHDASETVRHHDNPVVLAGSMETVEGIDGFLPDRPPYRDIGG